MCSASPRPADDDHAYAPALGQEGLPMNGAAERAERAVDDARRMYRRVLATWAMDVLALRAAGLDKPGFRLGERDTVERKAA